MLMSSLRTIFMTLSLVAVLLAGSARAAGDETRPGVVANCASNMLLRVWTPTTPPVSPLTATPAPGYPNIAVVYDNDILLSPARDNIHLCEAAKAFYNGFADDRNFLFVFADGRSDYAQGYNAYYSSVRNDVQRIGLPIYDRSTGCGSKGGSLLGFANMNGTDKWKYFVYPVLDLWPLGVIIHELGHQWIAFTNPLIKDQSLVTDPNSGLRSHWQALVHTGASIMYGNSWKQLTSEHTIFGRHIPATFISTSFPGGFSPLDKYLMGIYPANRVPNFFVINASSKKIWKHFAMPGNTAAGKRVDVSIWDVQTSLGGPRIPDVQSSLKSFKAGFILIVPKGQTVSQDALKIVEYFRKRIPEKLRDETDSVFSIDTRLVTKAASATPTLRMVPVIRPLGAR
jgi:hypothetical protein